jgi:hypothetical protein
VETQIQASGAVGSQVNGIALAFEPLLDQARRGWVVFHVENR